MNIKELFLNTYYSWSEDKAPILAAALAYYTIFSLVPFLFICMQIIGFFLGTEQAKTEIVNLLHANIGSETATQISTMLTNIHLSNFSFIATTIMVITLIIGATSVFSQLQQGLNIIWKVEQINTGILYLVKERLLSFALVIGIAFLLLVSSIMNILLHILSQYITNLLPGGFILSMFILYTLSLALLTLFFAMIFKILPDKKMMWKDIWLGAFITAVFFSLGKFILEKYLTSNDSITAFGVASAFILILVWVYYSAQIFFMGAEFIKIYSTLRHTYLD